jgi:hypothetical protein
MDDDDCYQICEFCFNHSGVFCSCAGAKKSMELELRRELLNSRLEEKNYFQHETGVRGWK